MSKRKYKNKIDKNEHKPVYTDNNEPTPEDIEEMKSFNATADTDSMPLF